MEAAPTNRVPCLPDTAPFTPEQRAYLNGFFAGLFSSQPVPSSALGAPASAPPLAPLLILFGSQTGTSEALAKRLAKEAGRRGFAPTLQDLATYPMSQFPSEERVLIVTSTFGDGDPPDNAKAFWGLLETKPPHLKQTTFSVCALGDSSYPKFCRFGVLLDAKLESLGAQRIHPRIDCDVDYEEKFASWMQGALSALLPAQVTPASAPEVNVETVSTASAEGSKYDRNRPFTASLLANHKLTRGGSAKDVHHFEVALAGSLLSYEAGDALGVFPRNCPALVEEVLVALGLTGEEPALGRDGCRVSIREALLGHYEVTRIPHALLQAVAERSNDPALRHVAAPSANGELTRFLWGREIIDLLLAYPRLNFTSEEFTGLLKKLPPRLYSISSSPKMHPYKAHLTVNVLRYQSLGRGRKGVCSTFLAERCNQEQSLAVYVHTNRNFRPPADPDTPTIMVGPGTGVAPFRAFLQERKATGARGKNWLFFGDQHAATDFLYGEELTEMHHQGLLTHLDTCFSRDQADKVYVQHRMRDRAKELYAWLESGACFYVCGDAQRMAKDVDAMLHEVVRLAGHRSPDQAAEYVTRLAQEKRYQRDVY